MINRIEIKDIVLVMKLLKEAEQSTILNQNYDTIISVAKTDINNTLHH